MKRMFPVTVVGLIVLLLASCSSDGTGSTPQTVPPATVISTLPDSALTVGEVLARLEAAWPSVQSMRTTFWSAEGPAGATPPVIGMVTVEEVRLPADRRLVISQHGMITDEQVVVDGQIYMKGTLVPAAIAPMVDTETWVEVDPAASGTGSPVSMQISYLLSPIVSPFADTFPETAGLEITPGDNLTVTGRSCETFAFGDPEGVSYELSLDAADLPCRFVQSASGHANVTLYDFNDPGLSIAAPTLSTPAAD
ncbi:MAG: hypothetical protein M3490_07745 [Chloroflexota bacterium]|nr:hypothetical protein [Chloroflexota bacterium]